ncbi:MAG: GTPase HflX [Halobacteriales archaeon]
MRAVVAKRVDEGRPDTAEIRRLVAAAGHEVVGVVTQVRSADPAHELGAGKVSTLAETVRERAAEVVVFDNRLGPYQTYNLGRRLPEGVVVKDRHRLILDLFGQRASTRTAQLQVELAELRYELPRAEAKASLAKRDEHPGFMGLGEYDESRKRDIKARISRIRDELDGIRERQASRRARRRDSGFDLVALAGYTNAGKSTLLRRLADDLSVAENDGLHPDLEPTAASSDRLFETLETTTRRVVVDERPVLLTDTVGFISDLPPWLVDSFDSTLDAVYRADLVLLVVDVSEDLEAVREKLVTSHDILSGRNQAPLVTVFNKVDRVDPASVDAATEALRSLAPAPVPVSAETGAGVDRLRRRLRDELPDWRGERLVLPQAEETMSLLSWLHDSARVRDVTYGGESVVVEFEAPPAVVERARDRAAPLYANTGP